MERFKKTIKKMAAVLGGTLMLGATMAGAFAQLEDLPQPFVSSAGVFDSYLVVGTLGWNPNAAYTADSVTGLARDVSGGIDLGAGFAQSSTTVAEAGAVTTTVSEGALLSQAGAVLGYGEDIDVVAPTGIGAGELPDIFGDETFKESKGDTTNDVDYEQTLTFDPDTAATLTVGVDINEDDANEEAGTYIFMDRGDNIYEYLIDFEDTVDFVDGSEADDFDNARITLQGQKYTISDVSADAGGLSQMELLSGAMVATQGEYTTQTYTVSGTTYEVEILVVADTSSEVQFRVNGETTDALVEGDTFTLSNGVELGVDEVLPNEGSEAAGADQVTFYIGARKVELNDGGEVKVNGKTLDDYTTAVAFTTDITNLTDISIKVEPDDDMWLGEGDEWVDPVFGQWKLVFAGIEKNTELIEVDVSGGDDGFLKFTNNEGDVIKIPTVLDSVNDSVGWGDDAKYLNSDDGTADADGEGIIAANLSTGMAFDDGHSCAVAAGDMEDECDGFLFAVISANNEARLYSVKDIDTTADTVDIIDEQNGDTIEDDASCAAGVGAISITGMGTIDIDCGTAATALTFDDIDLSDTGNMDTSLDASIDLGAVADAGNDTTITVEIIDGDGGSDTHTIDDDGSDDQKITFDAGMSWFTEDEDSDAQVATDVADWGIWYRNPDKTEDTEVDISYPEEIKDGSGVSVEVYVSPTGAVTSQMAGGAVNVNYINAATGISRTDQDFATAVPTKNVVLIGGPTVNELVNDLAVAGKTMTSADYTVDTAIIQYVEDAFGTMDALIIAGYDAKDTALASKVLTAKMTQGQFADKLVGDKVELGTAGASTVNEVTFK